MSDEQLSADFHLREFLISQTAARMGRVIVPTPQEIENLRRLCQQVLQPLRTHLGRPIFISSGLRPHWLNQAVGGEATSMHVHGCAADFKVAGVSDYWTCEAVRELALPVDQCILEFPPAGWIHVGITLPGRNPRGEFLTVRNYFGTKKWDNGIIKA